MYSLRVSKYPILLCMRIFALETDRQQVIRRFCHDHEGECVVLLTHYHFLYFLFAILREIFLTVVFITITFALGASGLFPLTGLLLTVGMLWFMFVFLNVFKSYIDLKFDFIVVTTDKVIVVDQTSIFKQEVKPIHVENVGGISSFTQFGSIFNFGGITIHLKEGLGGDQITLRYVPKAQEVAARISDVVTRYQRRQYRANMAGN